jgi:beta-glucosidase
MFDPGRTNGSNNTAAHQTVARRVAEEGIVLLKNKNNLLPLDAAKIKSIAVIGENAVRLHCSSGGSSEVKALYEITPLEGILRRAGKSVNVTFSQGYEINQTAQVKDGEVKLSFPPQDPGLMARAVTAAKAADVVIFLGGLHHGLGFDEEGADRLDLKLPHGQDELIQKIVAANPRTIVVLEGTVVETAAWIDPVPAVLEAWYPGMEGGNALARVLFGDVNPSGKLPCTFPKKLADTPAAAFGVEAYPGTNGTVTYKEGLLVGYRWYDTKRIAPQFPFGHGLSYTTFKYSHLKLIPGTDAGGPVVTAEFEIENTGTRDGAEVAQLYVHPKQPRLPRPEKELKGFQKIFLKAGARQTVSIPLARGAFAFFDPAKNAWAAEPGDFQISAGGSSRDLPLAGAFQFQGGASK